MSADGVTIPSCSSHVNYARGHQNFDPIAWSYYKQYITSAEILPGIIIGGLVLLTTLFYLLWLLYFLCSRLKWAEYRRLDVSVQVKRKLWSGWFRLFLLVSLLVVIGTSTWGLISGLKTTGGKVQRIWGYVDETELKLNGILTTLSDTSTSLRMLEDSLLVARSLVSGYNGTIPNSQLSTNDLNNIINSYESDILNGDSVVNTAINNIESYGINNIHKVERDYRSKTIHYWNTYRVVVIALAFGLLIFFSIICSLLILVERLPRVRAASCFFLWAWTGLLLVAGPGLVNFAFRFSGDGCLFGIKYAAQKINGGNKTELLLNYYFERTTIEPVNVSYALLNYNISKTIDDLQSENLQELEAVIASPELSILTGNLTPLQANSLNNLAGRVQNLTDSNFHSITSGLQELICCNVTSGLYELFVATTITASFAFVLCVATLYKTFKSVTSTTVIPISS